MARFPQSTSKQRAPLSDTPPPPRWKLVGAFAIVYPVWGSTYLFIRIGVADIPPAVLAGLRFVAADLGLLGIARGGRLPRGRDRLSVFGEVLLPIACVGVRAMFAGAVLVNLRRKKLGG